MINDAADGAFATFAEGFAGGMPQLVSRELVADTQTPVSAYLRLASGSRNTFLLESVEGGEIRGRFSVTFDFSLNLNAASLHIKLP